MTATLPTTNDLLLWALYYYARGWCIIPVNPNSKKPCLKHWKQYQTQRPTEQDLRNWFSAGKYKALAVICGAVSGYLGGFDFDSIERCEWWNRTHPDLARKLPTEGTVRGLHVLFHCDPVRTQRRHEYDVELLCEGAYIILTPSPGKRWLSPPNGQIPEIDPFSLGLETLGIKRPEPDMTPFTEEAEEPEEREEAEEEEKEMASVSSSSSASSVNTSLMSEDLQAKVDEAITKTLPTDTGQRNRCLFTFCRWLKAIPELLECSFGQLRPIAEKWHERACPVIDTKPFDDTWADFVYAWTRVRWPKGIVFDRAVLKAREDTENPPEAADYEDPCNQLLVRICWQLQQVNGDQPFYLSQRTAAGALKVTAPTAAKKMEMLMADGKLAIAIPHTNIFATRYRYIGQHSGKELE